MTKTTNDLNKLNHQQLRAEYKKAVVRVEATTTFGDFLFRLYELLRTPKYSVWKATKFDPKSGKPVLLSLKTEKQIPREWDWHPTAALTEEFKVPASILQTLTATYKRKTKSDNLDPVLWYDHVDKSMQGPFILMSVHSRNMAYNSNESSFYINVLRFTPICNVQPLYPEFV